MKTGIIGGVPHFDTTHKVRVIHFLDFLKDTVKKFDNERPMVSVFRNNGIGVTLRHQFDLKDITRIGVVEADLCIFGEPLFSTQQNALLGDYVTLVDKPTGCQPIRYVWRFVCVDGNYYMVKQTTNE